jgi:hypothetical protein
MPAHGQVKDCDKSVAMLSVHSKETDVKSFESRATPGGSDGTTQGVGARYAVVQGSKWFRDNNTVAKSGGFKDNEQMRVGETTATSLQKDAVATSEHGNEWKIELIVNGIKLCNYLKS